MLALWKIATAVLLGAADAAITSSRHDDDAASKVRLAVDPAVNWLRMNADPQQLEVSEEYLRKNALFALKAREEIPVAKDVPEELFLEEVLPYRTVDEPVDDWREAFFQVLAPHAKKATSLRSAVEDIVPRIFTELRASDKVLKVPSISPVAFKGNSTPAMMAPISETLSGGYASCTGQSILIVDGLRSVGIPARVVGTPMWNVKTRDDGGGGNHNWVEVWTGEGSSDGWHFFDAADHSPVTLDKAWFVPGNTKFATKASIHGIYSAEWVAGDAEYPLTWREPARLWRAKDRTSFYLAMSNVQVT
eukprot:TRINITY_DN80739_c0_g1_i1.p1 TRINITY_DN80739_c0_g1~~TRINITY_DN80739_c0_g1_i1.p1  ORF type:complete len:305 (-),score=72.45 TRINITY_DN80739_c0_g1_i1:14-928(-)